MTQRTRLYGCEESSARIEKSGCSIGGQAERLSFPGDSEAGRVHLRALRLRSRSRSAPAHRPGFPAGLRPLPRIGFRRSLPRRMALGPPGVPKKRARLKIKISKNRCGYSTLHLMTDGHPSHRKLGKLFRRHGTATTLASRGLPAPRVLREDACPAEGTDARAGRKDGRIEFT
jgi:hypothetical protein